MMHHTLSEVDITVFVSCYNEAEFIAATLDNVVGALREVGCTYEVLVIDDKSKDNSVAVVEEYIRSHPDSRVKLHANERNRGLANNYVEGAFIGRGKYYRLCCGDNSEPKDSLAWIFKHLGKADMIIPYENRETQIARSFKRRLLSRTFTFLVNHISGYRLRYYNGLAIHLRYNVMRWHPHSYGFGFQADLITRLLDEGASYAQIKRTTIEQKGSKATALTTRNLLSVGHTLLEMAIRRFRRLLYGHSMPKPREIVLNGN